MNKLLSFMVGIFFASIMAGFVNKPCDCKEYQVELDFDTVRVFQDGRYVDCYVIEGELNQFDEICALDNR